MKKLSKGFFLVLFVGIFFIGKAQRTTVSPYSKYGLGILRSESFAQNFSMGGVGIGLRSPRNINYINPASYNALTVTSFEVGVTNNALRLNDGIEQQVQNSTYIDHIVFGVPVMKDRWGMSFGILPFSSIGYDYTNLVNDPVVGEVTYLNTGNGGLNKAYLGNALKFNLDTTSMISFGANGYFLFGSMNYDEKVIYGDLSNGLNSWDLEEIEVSDFGIDFGIQYQKTFTTKKEEKYKLTLGATYSAASGQNSKHSLLIRTFTGNSTSGLIKDTISFINQAKSVTQLPQEIGVGFSLEKYRKWTIGVDFKSADWGSINADSPIFQYQSGNAIAAGIEIIPKYDAFNHYFKRVAYRFGARYNSSYITIDNQDLSEYGITFGVGLPIKRAETAIPSLSIGFEYGSRGEIGSGLIEETFFNLNIGLTINDRWFIKRKYD